MYQTQEDISGYDSPEEHDNYGEIEEDRAYIYKGADFTNHHSIPKSSEKSIRSDLNKLGIPNNIINIADSIYQDMIVGTKRGKRRKMLLFFCVFSAYNKESIPVDPIWLANVCGIDRSGISKALSMCSHGNTESSNVLVRYEPHDFIPTYFKKLNEMIDFHDDTLEEINDMLDEVMEKDPDLRDEKPETVAAAMLIYYLQLNGCAIEKDKYKDIFGRSDMTINKIKKRINIAYNK